MIKKSIAMTQRLDNGESHRMTEIDKDNFVCTCAILTVN